MYGVADTDKLTAAVGSANTFTFIGQEAYKLKRLQELLRYGVTLEIPEVVEELRSVEWPDFQGMDEVAAKFINGLEKCEGNAAYLREC